MKFPISEWVLYFNFNPPHTHEHREAIPRVLLCFFHFLITSYGNRHNSKKVYNPTWQQITTWWTEIKCMQRNFSSKCNDRGDRIVCIPINVHMSYSRKTKTLTGICIDCVPTLDSQIIFVNRFQRTRILRFRYISCNLHHCITCKIY